MKYIETTEHGIFTALSLEEAEWEEFGANEMNRQAYLPQPDKDKRETLKIEYFVADDI